MYVCICNGVTDRAIREAARDGARTLAELSVATGCSTTCGCCGEMAAQLMDETHREAACSMPGFPLALIAAAA